MSRANQWFVPGDGIAREVITADIQRYLGPDALVRPGPGTGENEGRPGYWITAYRTLTSQMIQDLKLDSTRWQQEQGRQEAGRGVAYQDSRTHAARQHWGPTQAAQAAQAQAQDPYDASRQAARPAQYPPTHQQPYATTDGHYTASPTTAYGTTAYSTPAAAQPRTQPEYGYPQQPPVREYPAYAAAQYPQHPNPDYRQPAAAPPQHGYTAPSPVPAPGYYIASDGRQYPLPTAQPNNRRNGP